MKRSVVIVAILAALVSARAAASSTPAPVDQATTYQSDPAHDGYIADAGLTAPFTQAWSITLPDAVSYPVIAQGRVFVTAANKTVYALNQATGSTIWSKAIGGINPLSGLAYDRGRVFVLSAQLTEPAQLVFTAFNAATGTIAWSEPLPGQTSSTSAPTAVNGIVYISGTGIDGTVYAVRESDGHILWTGSVKGGAHSSPAVTAQGVYVSYGCQQSYAFGPLSGSLLWHEAPSCVGGNGSTPVVASGHVFVRDLLLGNVILSASTGAVQGSFSAGPAPAVANDVAFMLSGSTLTAVDQAGLGTANWTFAGDGSLDTAPLVVGGLVFMGSGGGANIGPHLYALDVATGATVWSTELASAIASPDEWDAVPLTGLAAANGTLVVPAGHQLIAYRTDAPITDAPSNQSSPMVAGSGNTSEIEAADVGIWSGLPSSYAYQWELCDAAGANCADIAGATGPTFVPPVGDDGLTLRVKVAASNGVGSSSPVESMASVAVVAPPVLSTSPVVSGTTAVGQQLSTDNGAWTNAPTGYLYQWQRCGTTGSSCVNILHATNPQYTLILADAGHELRSEVLASNAAGPAASGYAPSAPTSVVLAKPSVITLPVISGIAKSGNSLSVTTGTWKNSPTGYAYQWFRCSSLGTVCKKIAGATSSSFLLSSADVGHKLKATVTASNIVGSAAATKTSAKVSS